MKFNYFSSSLVALVAIAGCAKTPIKATDDLFSFDAKDQLVIEFTVIDDGVLKSKNTIRTSVNDPINYSDIKQISHQEEVRASKNTYNALDISTGDAVALDGVSLIGNFTNPTSCVITGEFNLHVHNLLSLTKETAPNTSLGYVELPHKREVSYRGYAYLQNGVEKTVLDQAFNENNKNSRTVMKMKVFSSNCK